MPSKFEAPNCTRTSDREDYERFTGASWPISTGVCWGSACSGAGIKEGGRRSCGRLTRSRGAARRREKEGGALRGPGRSKKAWTTNSRPPADPREPAASQELSQTA